MSGPREFEGRCAVVTGATSGIGLATTVRLVAGGAHVIATGRRTERLEALGEELGGDVTPVVLDMTDLAAVDAFARNVPGGRTPDILVNNAGLALGLAPAAEADLADWDRMIATNISGLVHITRGLLPAMKAAPRADIVNISSVAGTYPYPGGNAYGATKAFVTQFSLNLRADLLGSNVRVTNVEPGMTDTEFSTIRFKGDKDKADTVYERTTPLTGDDIARVITQTLALPAHINLNRIEIMPVQQAFGPFAVARGE